MPLLRVTNLARTLDRLKEAGFWCLGLEEGAAKTLAEIDAGNRIALVLGAEGNGLRRLTRERCDLLARLPTRGEPASLNVSNAAAIALYELTPTAADERSRHDRRAGRRRADGDGGRALLMQLRDVPPGDRLPRSLGLLRRLDRARRDAEAALHRELSEEIGHRPARARFFIE